MGNNLFNLLGRFEYKSQSYPHHEKVRNYFKIISPDKSNEYFYNKMKTVWGDLFTLSFDDFNYEIEKINKRIDHDGIDNIKKSISPLPVYIPKIKFENHINLLIENYLPKLKDSFKAENPEYDFSTHSLPTVNTKILIEKFSNYEKLLEESKIKPHVGLFFPCFNEFSRKAALECFRLLPNYFVFSGGIDTTSALISHPNLLIRKDGYAPLLWIGSFDSEREDAAYHFESYGYNLTFNRKVHFNQCAESWLFGITAFNFAA